MFMYDLNIYSNLWRHVEWELSSHGYKYYRIAIDVQPSIDEYKRLNPGTTKTFQDENEYQQLNFILTDKHMDNIIQIIQENHI